MLETLFKETPTQVFFREYCVTYKNTYFEEHLRTAASIKRYLNVPWTLNSNHVSTGLKPLCSEIVFNKNTYHIKTNQLTRIAD